MRKLCILVSAIGLLASPMAWADPLAPGKPAGVHAAQDHMTNKEWLIVGGLGAVAAIVGIASAVGGHSPAAPQNIVVVTTTTTG